MAFMQIDEAFADSQAPNVAAIKNARGVVVKRKLVGPVCNEEWFARPTLCDRPVESLVW